MEQQPTESYETVHAALDSFANVLLENAVQHTEVWRRAFYQVPPESVPSLYRDLAHSACRDLLVKPGEAVPYYPEYYPGAYNEPIIATEVPDSILVTVKEFDHRKVGTDWHQTTLSFDLNYVQADDEGRRESARVSLEHVLGSTAVHREVFMMRYAETGYEGHGFKTRKVTPGQLQRFLGLLSANLGPHMPEKPFTDWMKQLVYTCEDTGAVFRYDPERQTHVSEDGVAMEDYRSPRADRADLSEGEEAFGLKETARFSMSYEEEV